MRTKPKDFEDFTERLKIIPPDLLKEKQEESLRKAEKEYKEFCARYEKGECYLCDEKLTRFDKDKPCLHWLLRKHKRVKKKHIKELLECNDMFQVIQYLRWLAKTEGQLSNINDFEAYDNNPKLVYQENIRCGEVEWTFWVKKEDLKGHKNRQSNFPHYHIQITIGRRPFVVFSDFHIALTEQEIFNVHARRGKFSNYKFAFPFGESYLDLFTFMPADEILNKMVTADNEDKAQYRLKTFIEADPGTTIKGEDILKLIDESKQTGIPLARLAKKLKNTKAKTIVMPENLVEPVSRKKRSR